VKLAPPRTLVPGRALETSSFQRPAAIRRGKVESLSSSHLKTIKPQTDFPSDCKGSAAFGSVWLLSAMVATSEGISS
jgi:hypothetical protein